MSTTSARASRGAWLAAAAPLACAVHCIAAPLVVLVLPAAGVHGPVETAVKLASAALALSFGWSGVRAHRRPAVLVPVMLGLALWVASSHAVGLLPETIGSALGGVMMAAGLGWSASLRHRAVCGACACPAHPHG